ncbi:MAG: hypothetical protein F4174_02650 [Acidobacteria bacterium]|nr:hypothetical protein [Gammaproteobacteria bacterium]MYF76258.1 hypothetical protein [Acidobacteriota bacterium]
MSELERQSTIAFERLCAHFEREQRRQGEQIEALQQRTERQSAENATLRRQFERLEGQVRLLAQDYRTLAETLRGPWS